MGLSFRSAASGFAAWALLGAGSLGGCEAVHEVRAEADARAGEPAAGESPETGGGGRDAAPPEDVGDDGGTSQDAGAGAADASPEDANAEDANAEDANAEDANAEDAGAEDAGPVADAAAEAAAPSGKACGGIAGVPCAAGEFCDYAQGDGCGIADGQGVCAPQPDFCTLDDTPVCGCDGQTYSNACAAHSMGVSVASEGKCKDAPVEGESCGPVTCGNGTQCCNALCGICTPPGVSCIQGCAEPDPVGSGDTCGGIAALECGGDEFCNYEKGQGCDGTIADAAGVCEATPTACTRDYRPVCACGIFTYANRCEAHRAGASVLHEGACTSTECEAIGGELHYSNGASVPSCQGNEEDHGAFVGPDGQLPTEPTRCCVPIR